MRLALDDARTVFFANGAAPVETVPASEGSPGKVQRDFVRSGPKSCQWAPFMARDPSAKATVADVTRYLAGSVSWRSGSLASIALCAVDSWICRLVCGLVNNRTTRATATSR